MKKRTIQDLRTSRVTATIVISLWTLTEMLVASVIQPDSVRVVKGQISDYYIPVEEVYQMSGRVYDTAKRPLEGATVMYFASPVHCNTNAEGEFVLNSRNEDLHIYVYYPGKKIAHVFRNSSDRTVDIILEDEPQKKALVRNRSESTPWYDPTDVSTSTYCNPLNISYNYEPYNDNVKKNGSFRSSADPTARLYKEEVFLFSTNQGGFHYSKNLSDWEFTTASFQRYPGDDDQCAPTAYVSGDTLFYMGSTYAGLPIWYSTDPKAGKFKRAINSNVLPSWDPDLFLDDDGALYLYYGSSNEYPLKGVRVSRNDFSPIGKIHDIMFLQPERHGWERFGMNNDDETTLRPFTEGAFVTKHNGKYYFQYGAPGTEFKVYANGVYVSDSPLGPYVYQKHNPVVYKPGGFVQGAGHGGTFTDYRGNYWHVATCMLSLKYKFERRIGLYPIAFDSDGTMYSNTAFGDYPCWNADADISTPCDRFTGWMLLSYRKRVEVSSVDSGYSASNLTDENMRTYWSAKTGEDSEWFTIDLEGVKTVKALQLNFYDHGTVQHNRAHDIYYQYRVLASENGEEWFLVVDKSDNDKDAPHDYIELKRDLRVRYLKVENLHVHSGKFSLSEFRVFGNANGVPPAGVRGFSVKRDKTDPRNALIKWETGTDAYGYNIYYGIAPNKMYNVINVNGDNKYDLRSLDVETAYYFTIEALNESGRSILSKTLKQ